MTLKGVNKPDTLSRRSRSQMTSRPTGRGGSTDALHFASVTSPMDEQKLSGAALGRQVNGCANKNYR